MTYLCCEIEYVARVVVGLVHVDVWTLVQTMSQVLCFETKSEALPNHDGHSVAMM